MIQFGGVGFVFRHVVGEFLPKLLCILQRASPEFALWPTSSNTLGSDRKSARVCFSPTTRRVIGDTEIGEQSSIWFGSVLRGDINRVVIGHHTNIQDNSVCHVADEFACVVGNYVTVGHRVDPARMHGGRRGVDGDGGGVDEWRGGGRAKHYWRGRVVDRRAAGAAGVAGVRFPRQGDQPARADGTSQDQGLGGEVLPRGGELPRAATR